MRNDKIIVINSLRRSGSNILWNIIQSHPCVCSPIIETGQVLFPIKWSHLIVRPLLRLRFLWSEFFLSTVGGIIDQRFFAFKLKNLYDQYNRFKYEATIYKRTEVEDSTLCIKSVERDIFLTDFISKTYRDPYFIGLIRNGYAVCEGMVRRGRDATSAAKLYKKYTTKIIRDSEKYKRYKVVKYEDLMKDPFKEAENLFSFCELEPTKLEKLRLKVKRVVDQNGAHKSRYGEAGEKYWFDKKEIDMVIITDQSDLQAKRLKARDRILIEQIAGDILKEIGY